MTRVEAHAGEKLSVLFRIEGDPEFPYSEAVGLLQRVDATAAGERTWVILKRDGTTVEVPERAVVRYRVVPPSRGPLRIPKSWEAPAGDS